MSSLPSPRHLKSACLTALTIAFVALPLPAKCADTKPVMEQEVIDEPASIVWRAIQNLRTIDAQKRRLISYANNEAVIEEKFPALPIVGDSTCLYKECEVVPEKQIDYSLIRSDHFKVFEGTWNLERLSGGRTKVSLSSNLDTGMRIPFWREITRAATSRSVKHRLQELCTQAHKLASEQACATTSP
jgi:hypothetical protein